MTVNSYFDFLAKFGVGGAHPGGLQLTKKILEKENITSTSWILDAGCGTGQTAAYLYNEYKADIYGLEINPIMIKKAKHRFTEQQLPIHLVQGSIEDIPFEDNTFDFILSESVLAFVDKEKALSEFYRVLKKGGRFISNEMTINYPLSVEAENEIKEFYHLDSLLLEEEWSKLLRTVGFKDLTIEALGQMVPQMNAIPPEFHFSKDVGLDLFEVLNDHATIIVKYQDSLSYRILTGTK